MTIHAARLDHSPRLQRVYEYLRANARYTNPWRSTREILRAADVCNVSTCVAELEAPINGFTIECERRGRYYFYRLKEYSEAA